SCGDYKISSCFKHLVFNNGLDQCQLRRAPPMGPLDALLHLLNFFAPAVGVGLLSAAVAKLVWPRALREVGWRRLALRGCAAAALALVAGLVFFGRDGRML